ncbi:MAG: acyl-CoA synthetase (AMP-forming)/AMP-acid ligase [Actinomycetia bacterium]|nr:acyl-CoA synthetase (AMP-forming)/AMP-acid ligase [Actinomycetes bacterium]
MPADATIPELLRAAVAQHPDREAYVHGPARITYAQLGRMVDGFSRTLLNRGVRPGDVVMLRLPSSIRFAAAYLGAIQVGAITTALNGRLGPVEQQSIHDRTEPVLVLDPGHPILAKAFSAPPVRLDDLPTVLPNDPACIVWTSGTTGHPKGAVYDHLAQAAISRNIGQPTIDGERRLVVLPFAHVGFMTRMWDELAHGSTVVVGGEPWNVAEHLRLIRDERITMTVGVPTQWSLLLEHPDLAHTDFSRLRVAAVGGAGIPADLVPRMRERLGCPVITRYTSTEAGAVTSTVIGDPDEVVSHTVGRPAPEVELRVVGTEGEDVARGAIGEVICRSPAMMRGYWKDPELTAEAIDADGFLHTGDLGRLTDDGYLQIVGRIKEMYIRGGYNVYPGEVNAVLAEHPAVAEVAVVGVPDPVMGEIGVAFVVLHEGRDAPTLDGLRERVRTELADYKRPDRLVVVDEIPLTSMLKVDTHALRKRYLADIPVPEETS